MTQENNDQDDEIKFISYLTEVSMNFEDEEKPLNFSMFNEDINKVEIYTRTVITLMESFGKPETEREIMLFAAMVNQVVENSWNQIYRKVQGF